MDQLDRHRALAHRRGHPLDRTSTHVASCEHTGQVRLQGVRLPRKVPPEIPIEHGALQRSPCQDEAAFVEFDGALEPASVGLRPDEDKECFRSEGSTCARAVVLDYDSL